MNANQLNLPACRIEHTVSHRVEMRGERDAADLRARLEAQRLTIVGGDRNRTAFNVDAPEGLRPMALDPEVLQGSSFPGLKLTVVKRGNATPREQVAFVVFQRYNGMNKRISPFWTDRESYGTPQRELFGFKPGEKAFVARISRTGTYAVVEYMLLEDNGTTEIFKRLVDSAEELGLYEDMIEQARNEVRS